MANHQTKKDYLGRISNVILYINEHLDEDLPLYQLANIACFSSFHFSYDLIRNQLIRVISWLSWVTIAVKMAASGSGPI